jgi:hypothetical protein
MRPSLSARVRFASTQRVSSAPVIRQSAETARRIEASARQGLPQLAAPAGAGSAGAVGCVVDFGADDGVRGAAPAAGAVAPPGAAGDEGSGAKRLASALAADASSALAIAICC